MTNVKLRTKAISGNRHSLYLDYYPPIIHPDTGKPTRREFLKLYLFDRPKNPFDKEQNKETKALAENIRARRQIEVQNETYGFLSRKKHNANFVQYFKELAAKRSGSNSDNWFSALNYLERFTEGNLRFADLTDRFCDGFRDYLLSARSERRSNRQLSTNSAHSYFNKFKAALKQAFKDGLLQNDLNAKVKPIKPAETQRQFLTLEELNKLVDTECQVPILKKAALFSSLSGLRFSDIQKLTWAEVQKDGDLFFLQFRQKKTKGVEVLPISNQAFTLMGSRQEPQSKVFIGLKYSAYNNLHLKKWVMNAGINKDITFHCFRHTYAILQIANGTDIYTVSKMLGHRDLKTTQIYTQVLDQAKRNTTDKIKLDF